MKFYEKLDFFMNITKTTNSSLSMQISLDASHVSRLRRGERQLVPGAEYINQMAVYFVSHCIDDYQKAALLDASRMPTMSFKDLDTTIEGVYKWLIADEKLESASVSSFLNGLNHSKNGATRMNLENSLPFEPLETKPHISLYYGTEGKREAVIRFLSIVLKKEKPGEILLYSDESMAWLTEDQSFQVIWMTLISRVIAQGNHIKIIHNVSRNLDEMLEALSKWIPLYMTGAIEPFYYPKKRDGIFKRTMFIASGKAALSANSFDAMSDKVTNILFQKEKAVESLVDEFNSYLSLCKPLMHIFTDDNRQEYLKMLEEFEREIENTVVKTEQLSLLTMPNHVVSSILNRTDMKNKKEWQDYFIGRKESFLEVIKTKSFNEIIKIDDIANIKEGLVKIGYTGIRELSEMAYTPLEYRDHLKNIIDLLNKYDNYNVVIDGCNKIDDRRFYVKENLGVIVEKTAEPHVVFVINEANMSAAFWDYVNRSFEEYKQDKDIVIKQLENLVEELSDY